MWLASGVAILAAGAGAFWSLNATSTTWPAEPAPAPAAVAVAEPVSAPIEILPGTAEPSHPACSDAVLALGLCESTTSAAVTTELGTVNAGPDLTGAAAGAVATTGGTR